MRLMNVLALKTNNDYNLEKAKDDGRIEILTAICKLNKGDGVCKGKNGKGKDCIDCAFRHLWELTNKPTGSPSGAEPLDSTGKKEK